MMLKRAAILIEPLINGFGNNLSSGKKFFTLSSKSMKQIFIKDHFDFDKKVINADKPIVVNFHAEWCEPCSILTPKMTELLENNPDIDLAIIDVDTNYELVNLFEVKAVPAVLGEKHFENIYILESILNLHDLSAFRNGVVVDKFIGLVDANMIEELIRKLSKRAVQP